MGVRRSSVVSALARQARVRFPSGTTGNYYYLDAEETSAEAKYPADETRSIALHCDIIKSALPVRDSHQFKKMKNKDLYFKEWRGGSTTVYVSQRSRFPLCTLQYCS
jgi:hypothetical protein